MNNQYCAPVSLQTAWPRQIMEVKKPAFKIGSEVKIANDLKTIYKVEKIHPDGKYDLKPLNEGDKLTGVDELQLSSV